MLSDINFDDLPEEPELQFRILAERIFEVSRNYMNNNDEEGERLYISQIIHAAKALGLNRFAAYEKKYLDNDGLNFYTTYRDLKFAVDGYCTEILIQNAQLRKNVSVALDSATKQKIHHYILQIKACVEESDLEEQKKNALYNKLNDFSKEVDKSRTSLQSGMIVFNDVCAAFGNGVKKLEPARKWVDSIAGLLDKAKEIELSLPRISYEAPKRITGSKEVKAPELDDEIPF